MRCGGNGSKVRRMRARILARALLIAALALPATGRSEEPAVAEPDPGTAPAEAPAEAPPPTEATPPADPSKVPPAALPPKATPLPPPVAEPEHTFIKDLLPSSWKSVGLFLGGAATGFVAHESCHIFVNYTLGSRVSFLPVKYMDKIPFFTIAPDVSCSNGRCTHSDGRPFAAGPAGMYAIVSAGYQCQQIADEIILSTDPQLFHHEAPFRKGALAFNTILSLGYAISNWAGQEPSAGDSSTMDQLPSAHLPRGLIAMAIFVPAVLDILRFFLPDQVWLPWVSRASKSLIVGFAFAI